MRINAGLDKEYNAEVDNDFNDEDGYMGNGHDDDDINDEDGEKCQ